MKKAKNARASARAGFSPHEREPEHT